MDPITVTAVLIGAAMSFGGALAAVIRRQKEEAQARAAQGKADETSANGTPGASGAHTAALSE
jgi:hypothetical protein